MDWEGSEKVNVNVLKDNFVCRMSFLHNDFYRPSTWQGRHFFQLIDICTSKSPSRKTKNDACESGNLYVSHVL